MEFMHWREDQAKDGEFAKSEFFRELAATVPAGGLPLILVFYSDKTPVDGM